MDLSKIKNLSDDQLVALYRNPTTVGELKKAIFKEITSREVAEMELESNKDEVKFTTNEKLRLIFLPFSYRYHRRTMLGDSWTRKRDKQFWSYITLGIATYIVILMIVLLFRNR